MPAAGPVLAQGVTFLVAALTGIALGFGLDVYRAALRAWRVRPPVLHVLDVLFVLALLPMCAAGWLAANWGAFRVYGLAALILGAAAYLALASPYVLPVLEALARAAAWALRTVGRVAAWPVERVTRLLRSALAAVRRMRRPRPPADIPGA